MKKFMLLSFLLTSFAYAQTFEERVDQVHPNESVEFNDPKFLGMSLLGVTGGETHVNAEKALSKRGKSYCLFLGYKGLLAITSEQVNQQMMLTLKETLFIENSTLIETYQNVYKYGWDGRINPSKVKSLRCKI